MPPFEVISSLVQRICCSIRRKCAGGCRVQPQCLMLSAFCGHLQLSVGLVVDAGACLHTVSSGCLGQKIQTQGWAPACILTYTTSLQKASQPVAKGVLMAAQRQQSLEFLPSSAAVALLLPYLRRVAPDWNRAEIAGDTYRDLESPEPGQPAHLGHTRHAMRASASASASHLAASEVGAADCSPTA